MMKDCLYSNFKNIFHQVIIEKKLPQLRQNLQFVTAIENKGIHWHKLHD